MRDHTRWNLSPKGKIYKAKWQDEHRQTISARRRAKYRRDRVKVIRQCATEGCKKTWVSRHPFQRRLFCLPCAQVFFPPGVVRRRKDWKQKAA